MRESYPDLYYEQYLLNELDPKTARELEQQPDFQERIDALRAENEQILRSLPPAPMAARIRNQFESQSNARAKAPRHRRLRRSLLLAGPAVAALTVALVLSLQGVAPATGVTGPESEQVRLKGGEARIVLYTEQNGAVAPVQSGAQVSAGSTVQVAYNAAGAAHGAVYSIDGSANLTIHYPVRPTDSTRLDQGGVQRLPRSFTLDDAPLFERFYLVTSDQQFDSRELATTIRRQADRVISEPDREIEIGEQFIVHEFTLWKGE